MVGYCAVGPLCSDGGEVHKDLSASHHYGVKSIFETKHLRGEKSSIFLRRKSAD